MDDPRSLLVEMLATPIGTALVVADRDGHLRALDWADHEARMLRLLRLQAGRPEVIPGRLAPALRSALAAYFEGDLAALDTIAVRTGGTRFQREVWAALRHIPAGMTISYGALAARLGRPAAVRAVGAANGANPVGVVIPCHRMIGADGGLAGYGGGLHRKRWLLDHERRSQRASMRA